MRRLKYGFALLFALLLIFGFSLTAFAQSPHFIGTPTCTKSLSTGLTCSGKAAGLGNAPSAAFLTADSETATYECVNHGGNVAPGQPIVIKGVPGPTHTITPPHDHLTLSPPLPPP